MVDVEHVYVDFDIKRMNAIIDIDSNIQIQSYFNETCKRLIVNYMYINHPDTSSRL